MVRVVRCKHLSTHWYLASAGLVLILVKSSFANPNNLNSVTSIQRIVSSSIFQRTNVLTVSIRAKNESMLPVFGGIVDSLLKNLDYIKFQIEGIDSNAIGFREYSILLVDSFDAFKHINPGAKTEDYDINEFYLIFLKPNNQKYYSEMRKILTYCWSHYIVNVGVFVQESSEVSELYTYFPFSESQCRNSDPILINRFINGTPIYGFSRIFPEKLQSLQNCPLTAALWDSPPYIRISPNQTGHQKFIDFEGILLQVLAKKLNFSLEYIVPPNNEQRGKRFPNGTTNGAMQLLQDRIADLSLGSFRYTLERNNVLTAALPYYQTWQVFGVLKTSLPYTSIEILMFPFDASTWLCLVCFMGIIVGFGILALSYNTIFGKMFLEVSLNNIVSILFGISVPRSPRRVFTRYLLIMWIIFAFVMRCAYQSLLFQLLRSSLYRKPPNKLEELQAQDFTLIMTKGTFDSVNTIPKIKNNQIKYLVTDNSSEMSTFKFVEDTPGRYAGISPMDFLIYYAMTESGRGKFHILPEKIFTQHITMYFTKHSFLIERFNELLMNLRSFGLIDFWATQSLDITFFREMDSTSCAGTSMNLTQFKGLFDVYEILIVVSFIIFILEVCSKKVRVLRTVLDHVH